MLAESVRTQMEARGWKLASILVRRSGLSQTLISKILRGQIVNITPDTIDKLATALDLPPEALFHAALADVRTRRAVHEDVDSACANYLYVVKG